MLADSLKSFSRSWVQHTGMQLATLSVLTATFSIVAVVLSLSMNVNKFLASWGDTVQVTAYIQEAVTDAQIEQITRTIEAMPAVGKVAHTPRDIATENFKTQMASYAPDLLTDADFANPFPASFKISLKGGLKSDEDFKTLEKVAAGIGAIKGIEDVSYGQSWVKSYSTFVSAMAASGGTTIAILLLGGLFVVSNSIRAGISARREEIEILELIGATASMIRRPYVVEGALLGGIAAILAIGISFGVQTWQISLLSKNLELARLVSQVSFLGAFAALLFIVLGSFLGAFGAWVTVRKINDGWSAAQKTAS
jgi:cell division transport system permease protein